MTAKPAAAAAATLCLDSLKHPRQVAWIVAGSGHDLRPEDVCLSLILTAIFQRARAKTNLTSSADNRARHTANDRAGNLPQHRSDLKLLRLGSLRRCVTKCDVANLVGHNSSHLTFAARRLNHAAIDIHWTTRQRKRVNVARVDDVKRVTKFWMLELFWNRSYESLAN